MDAAKFVWSLFLLVGVIVLVAVVFSRRRGGHGMSGPGPGAYGAVYDLLNEDKRKAIEMIVEDKAGYRDPEDADGKPKAGSDKCRMPKLLILAFVI